MGTIEPAKCTPKRKQGMIVPAFHQGVGWVWGCQDFSRLALSVIRLLRSVILGLPASKSPTLPVQNADSFFLAARLGLWDLSSWTRDPTCAPCIESVESSPLEPGKSQECNAWAWSQSHLIWGWGVGICILNKFPKGSLLSLKFIEL